MNVNPESFNPDLAQKTYELEVAKAQNTHRLETAKVLLCCNRRRSVFLNIAVFDVNSFQHSHHAL